MKYTSARQSLAILALLFALIPVHALFGQGLISGYVYSLQTGESLMDVRVQVKNQQGIDIPRLPAVYTDTEGYFKVEPPVAGEYRLMFTYTHETPEGQLPVSLFTNSDLIQVDTAEVALTLALSSAFALASAEQATFFQTFNQNFDEATTEQSEKYWQLARKAKALRSRLSVDHKDIPVFEVVESIGDYHGYKMLLQAKR